MSQRFGDTKILTNNIGELTSGSNVTIDNLLKLSTALEISQGGTGNTTYTNGQLLIGNTTGNTLTKATLTGTSNQVVVTNGTGTITLSTPQNIHTAATPTFAGLTLSGNEAITIADTVNALCLTLIQNDVTNNPKAFSITNATTSNSIFVDANGNTGTTATSSGAIFVENTGNTGVAFGIYSNQASPAGPLVQIQAANAGFNQSGVLMYYDGTLYGLELNIRGGGQGIRIAQTSASPATNRPMLELNSNQNRTNGGTPLLQLTDSSTSSTKNVVELSSSSTGVAGINITMTGTTSKGIDITHSTSINREALGVFITSAFTGTGTTSGARYEMSNASSTGTLIDISQSGTGAAINLTANAVTTGNGVAMAANGLTTGINLSLTSTSTTGGASGVSYMFKSARSGANANTAHTAYGVYSTVTNTNATSGTNVAAYLSASGATTANYALQIAAGNIILAAASDIILDTTTGTKIGTATTQKLGFYNATPIVQEANTVDLGTVLSDLGLRAAGTAYPITTSGTVTLTGTLAFSTLALKAGTSTGNIAKVGGAIYDHFTDTTVGGAEADIYTDTTPANIFATNGDKIIASYNGNFVTVGTELTELKAYFAGTAIWDSTGVAPSTGTTSWRVYVELIRVSSTVVRYNVSLNTSGASGFVYDTSGELTGLTLSGTNILKLTGQSSGVGSGSGDIVGKAAYVTWLPAA